MRDDRVFTYFDLAAGKEVVFVIPLNASYRGRFYLPPIDVRPMYDETLGARTAGQWIEVTSIGQQG